VQALSEWTTLIVYKWLLNQFNSKCGGSGICEHNRHRRRKESTEKSEDEDLEEDEEFYNQVQHAVQVMTVRRAPQTKAKVSVSTD
jgi:hypothetical protein